jgi:dUTP pyrophosphatase
MTDQIRFMRLTVGARIPTFGSAHAAGLDLYADLSREGNLDRVPFVAGEQAPGDISRELGVVIAPGERRLIKNGLAAEIPHKAYARIAPRSGLAFKHGMDVLAGVIDEDYRGEWGVLLINLGGSNFVVRHGDRIAQAVIERISRPVVSEVFELSETGRGGGGYGSTGV